MIIVNKQYIRIVDHLEKEVQIYDTINEKKIFNIFFNELDSAICLNGALTDTVDLLNDLSEENDVLKQQLKTKYIVNKQYEELQRLKQENEQLKSSFTEFAKMIEFDIDNGIEVYPKRLLEYIINISKEYGK